MFRGIQVLGEAHPGPKVPLYARRGCLSFNEIPCLKSEASPNWTDSREKWSPGREKVRGPISTPKSGTAILPYYPSRKDERSKVSIISSLKFSLRLYFSWTVGPGLRHKTGAPL